MRQSQHSSPPYVYSPQKPRQAIPRLLTIGIIVLVLLLGIGFRSFNLGKKAYWVDEVHTSVRISGYTKADVTDSRFDNQIHSVADLEAYQIPSQTRSLGDVLNALVQHPEHPPLYYLMAHWWVQAAIAMGVPPSVAIARSLALLFSVLAIPCVIGFVRELFRSNLTATIAFSIFALSPLHVLYGQEARAYSLWTLVTVLSCWTFLRAVRLSTLRSWLLYGLTLTIGWYSHLLFATVAIAQALYFFLFVPRAPDQEKPKLQSFGLIFATSLLLFSPWIAVFFFHFSQVQNVVEATQQNPSLGYLLSTWGRNLSRVWFGDDLGSINILVFLATIYGLVYLWQTTSRRISGFLLLLISINALALMLPDMVTGGISSTRIRYLLPAYMGIQLAIAHLFSHRIEYYALPQHLIKPLVKQAWKIGLISVLLGGAIAGCIGLTQTTNWAKSDKSFYYPKMAQVINASDHPLVITDNSATYTLALTHYLDKHVHLQLVDLQRLQKPQDLVIPMAIDGDTIDDLFLFAPSPPLHRLVKKRIENPEEGQNYGLLTAVVQQSDRFQLLQTKHSFQTDS
ncbi:MAG: glycosyltransferase family 39 protein [Cyanobacteria bacterium P01_F01_bin.150]